MDPIEDFGLVLTRRLFFGRSAAGIGAAALASLLDRDAFASAVSQSATAAAPQPDHSLHEPSIAAATFDLFLKIEHHRQHECVCSPPLLERHAHDVRNRRSASHASQPPSKDIDRCRRLVADIESRRQTIPCVLLAETLTELVFEPLPRAGCLRRSRR